MNNIRGVFLKFGGIIWKSGRMSKGVFLKTFAKMTHIY
jgi:hypothetical protein